MKSKLSFFIIPVLGMVVVLLSGCLEKPACEKPFISVGKECCLDKNNNKICDDKETTTTQPTDLRACLDTDKGQNYNRKGIVFYTTQEGEKGNFIDHCWKDGRVVEYWCTPRKTPKESLLSCPKGYKCVNGKCAKAS